MAKKQAGASAKRKKKVQVSDPNGLAFLLKLHSIMLLLLLLMGMEMVLSWSSAGKEGFKGSRKNTPYAAQMSAETASKAAHEMGLRRVQVFVKGPGSGREAAVRAMGNAGLEVTSIIDRTPIPHNGCRPPKRRRV